MAVAKQEREQQVVYCTLMTLVFFAPSKTTFPLFIAYKVWSRPCMVKNVTLSFILVGRRTMQMSGVQEFNFPGSNFRATCMEYPMQNLYPSRVVWATE
jgi:hypothetical protein